MQARLWIRAFPARGGRGRGRACDRSEELRRAGSGVYAGAFCPGPVDTAFGAAAGVKQSLPGLSARRAAKLAVDGMFARKAVIVPGFGMRAALFFERFLPERAVLRITWRIQSRKTR